MAAPAPRYVRLSDAPAMFSMSLATIYRRAGEGAITIHKVGGIALLKVSEMDEWIESGGQAKSKVGAAVGAK